MLTRQYYIIETRSTPLPISAVIQAANRFGCDIYIVLEGERINVKCYEEIQKGIQMQKRELVFYFDGADEEEADRRFRRLFGI